MIESICNIIQLIFAGLSSGCCARNAVVSGKRAWYMLSLASFGYFLGDLYWEMYLAFYDQTPHYSNISYISWCACYMFLLLLLIEIRDDQYKNYKCKALWIIPVVNCVMALYFMQWGSYLDNIVSFSLMTLLVWHSIGGLVNIHKGCESPKKRWIYLSVLWFTASEYFSWFSSVYWMGDTIRNPYFWADTMLSFSFLLQPLALRKAVTDELH